MNFFFVLLIVLSLAHGLNFFSERCGCCFCFSSNRMAGSNTRWSNGFHGKPIKDEDFDEEEAWGFASEREEEAAPSPISRNFNHFNSSGSSSSSSAWLMQSSAPKMIPKAKTAANQEPKTVKRSSAPLDIPDWSKIYGRNGHMGSWMNDEYGLVDGAACNGFVNDDDDDDDGDVMVPPHEWIARKLARSQISSFSVCEGIGRTLKGRDLSKVRNAILTKTGFLE